VNTLEQDLSLIAQARRSGALARRARLRARLDMFLVGAATAGAALGGSDAHEALMAASAALSLGILFYVVRRDRDVSALAGQGRWRDEALQGRGLSLKDWQAGAELAPWETRRGSRPQQPD
jgi:hypothetical protein